jgi:hypothetical protein
LKIIRYPQSKIINILLAVLTICLAFVIGYRIAARRQHLPDFQKMASMRLVTLEENEKAFADLLGDEESFMLFFELSNCPPCISRGLNELRELKKNGKNAYAVVIHNWADEWIHWARNVDFSPIYMLKKESLEREFFFPYLPVLVRLKNRKVYDYKYITF